MGETERKREQQIREKKKQRETRREAQVECAAKVKMTQSAGQNRRTLCYPVTHTHKHTHSVLLSQTHTHRYTVAHGGTHKLWKMAASQLDSVLITLNLIFISGSASLFIFCAVVVVLPLSPPLSPFSLARTIAPRTLPGSCFACCFCFLGCFFALLVAVACKAKKQRWLGAVSRLSPPPLSLCLSPLHPHMAAMP